MRRFYVGEFPDFFCNPQNYHFKSKISADYPINDAAFLGDLDNVKKLIRLGVEIDARGDLGYTALHQAVHQGHFNVVKFLMESGADASIKTELGKTAFDLAKMVQRLDIYDFLCNYHINSKVVILSELLSFYSRRYFFNEIINLNSITECGEFPIHIAVKREKIEEVKCLINAGVNLNAKTDDGFEFTPLHYSIGRKDFEVMKLLLSNNVELKLKSGMGYSPLDLAIIMGDKKSIFYLYNFIHNQDDKNYTTNFLC